MGGTSIDTSGLDALKGMAYGVSNAGQGILNLGQQAYQGSQDWLNWAKQIYNQGPGWLINQYKNIVGGGNPYAAAQASGLFDVATQQAGGWANKQKQAMLDTAGLGPVGKVLGTEGVGFQAEQMKSQNIMSTIQHMLDQIGSLGMQGFQTSAGTGTGMMGTAFGGMGTGLGGMSAGMQGMGQYASDQTALAMQRYQAQGAMMGNIVKSIASIGGTVGGELMGAGGLGGDIAGAITGAKPWGYQAVS